MTDADEIVIDDRQGKPPRTWDFFLTVLLLFLLVVITVVFVAIGFSFGVKTLDCSSLAGACNSEMVAVGSVLVIVGTPLIAIAGVVLSMVWIARRKLSFLVALIAVAASVLVFAIGNTLVGLAVPA
jgi:hypothetical protein